MPDEKSQLVYSTDKGLPAPDKIRKAGSVEKAPRAGLSPRQQKVTVRLDRKGRGGKSVSVIEGLLMAEKGRETLLKQLKARLGQAARSEIQRSKSRATTATRSWRRWKRWATDRNAQADEKRRNFYFS